MPGYTGVHIDRALTNLSLFYRNPAYIADEIAPPVQVRKESDKYFIYGKEHFKAPSTLRADKDEATKIDYSVSDDTYYCQEYAVAIRVSDRERDNADAPLKPDTDAVEMLTEVLLLDREVRVANAILSSSNWGSYSTSHFGNLALAWDDLNGANPRSDLYHAKYSIWRDSRKQANKIVVPVEVAYQLSQMDMIDELRKYTDPGLVTNSGIPPVLWGLGVLEAQATYDSSAEGLTESFNECWGLNVLVYHKSPNTIGLKTLTLALTMQKQPFQTRKWREEPRKSDVVENSHLYATKVVAPACGFVLTNVMTAQS